MMPGWIQLPREKAHSFYRVPLELAGDNFFYGLEHSPRDTDGPWPLLAFLGESGRPGIMTLHLYTIEAEELAVEAFNPLAQPCGYLSLGREALTGLVTLVSSHAAKLTPQPGAVRRMFRQIDDENLADWGLHPEWFPDAKDQYYQQIYDPLEPAQATTQTILIFSAGQPSQPSSRLYFKIAQFPQRALQPPSFDILDDSFPRIHLDRSGMEELARLLEARLVNLLP